MNNNEQNNIIGETVDTALIGVTGLFATASVDVIPAGDIATAISQIIIAFVTIYQLLFRKPKNPQAK